jgi:demethylmenaquinone methyltransferase/2-methoxy-6-polyprenyl-1,4-benzoquinol methylase
MVLETGEVEHPVLRTAIKFYFEQMVPRLGGWVSGKPEAYQYLQSSSVKFPSGDEFCDLMRESDCFSSVEFRPLMGGASFIYKAVVNSPITILN